MLGGWGRERKSVLINVCWSSLFLSCNVIASPLFRISMLHCSGGECLIDELVKIVSGATCKGVALYDEGVARMASTLGAVAVALRALGHYSSIDAVSFEYVKGRRLGAIEPEPSICETYSDCFKQFELALSSVRNLYRALNLA